MLQQHAYCVYQQQAATVQGTLSAAAVPGRRGFSRERHVQYSSTVNMHARAQLRGAGQHFLYSKYYISRLARAGSYGTVSKFVIYSAHVNS